MHKTVKKILIDVAQIVGLIVAALLVWYVAAAIAHSELILPDPQTVIGLTFRMLGDGSVWLALLATLGRSLAAFVLSVAFAFGLALLVGVYPKTRFCVDAIVTFLRALPTIAIILVTLVLFPSSIVPIVVAFLVASPVAFGTFVRQFEHNAELFDVCKVYDVTPSRRVRYYLLPMIRDELLSVAQEELPLCIKVVVAGEVLALPLRSVGRDMYVGKVNVDTARIVALTLIVLVVCFVIGGVLELVRRRVHD